VFPPNLISRSTQDSSRQHNERVGGYRENPDRGSNDRLRLMSNLISCQITECSGLMGGLSVPYGVSSVAFRRRSQGHTPETATQKRLVHTAPPAKRRVLQ
jgi:hypothetical protein